jgi:hypothetical protein
MKTFFLKGFFIVCVGMLVSSCSNDDIINESVNQPVKSEMSHESEIETKSSPLYATKYTATGYTTSTEIDSRIVQAIEGGRINTYVVKVYLLTYDTNVDESAFGSEASPQCGYISNPVSSNMFYPNRARGYSQESVNGYTRLKTYVVDKYDRNLAHKGWSPCNKNDVKWVFWK